MKDDFEGLKRETEQKMALAQSAAEEKVSAAEKLAAEAQDKWTAAMRSNSANAVPVGATALAVVAGGAGVNATGASVATGVVPGAGAGAAGTAFAGAMLSTEMLDRIVATEVTLTLTLLLCDLVCRCSCPSCPSCPSSIVFVRQMTVIFHLALGCFFARSLVDSLTLFAPPFSLSPTFRRRNWQKKRASVGE